MLVLPLLNWPNGSTYSREPVILAIPANPLSPARPPSHHLAVSRILPLNPISQLKQLSHPHSFPSST
jgi:hypothetical protein